MRAAPLVAALAFWACAPLQAQTLYKCQDAKGKITYSGQECGGLGLKPAGEVKGETNVVPSQPAPFTGSGVVRQPMVEAPPEAAEEKKQEPERRCFTVKTAKGVATRCNDTPE